MDYVCFASNFVQFVSLCYTRIILKLTYVLLLTITVLYNFKTVLWLTAVRMSIFIYCS